MGRLSPLTFASLFALFSVGPVAGCGPTGSSADGGALDDACSGCELIDAAADVDAANVADAEPGADANTSTPSESYVYYYGDFATADLFQVARIDLGNGAREILELSGFTGGASITGLAVSPDNLSIAVAGKNAATDKPSLRVYSADGLGAPTVIYESLDSTRTIAALSFSPDGEYLAFTDDSELLGARVLYAAPIDNSASAKRVSLAPVSGSQDIATYAWSRDSLHIAFVGDLVASNVDALWTVNPKALSPTIVEIVTTAELGARDVGQGVDFDASNRLYFRTDHELLDNQFRLYRSEVDGSGRVQVAGTALVNGAGEAAIGNFRVSPDGSQLAFASDAPTANLYQVYVLPLASSAPTLVSNLSTSAPASGLRGPNFFEAMAWSPDGSKLAMSADWPVGSDVDNDFGMFVLPSSGAAGGTRLAKPEVGSGDASFPLFSSDSSQILFRGDMLQSNHSELFATGNFTGADQSAASIRLVQTPAAGAVEGFAVSN